MNAHVDMVKGVILPYVNFFVFLALAIYFFRKPARAAAAKAREDFEKLSADAARARKEAEARLAELNKRRQGLEQEIAELKQAAKQSADADAARIVADAERLATHLAQEARRIADAEIERARTTLRDEIVAAVQASVSKKIAEEVKADKHLSIIRKQIGELSSLKAEV